MTHVTIKLWMDPDADITLLDVIAPKHHHLFTGGK